MCDVCPVVSFNNWSRTLPVIRVNFRICLSLLCAHLLQCVIIYLPSSLIPAPVLLPQSLSFSTALVKKKKKSVRES